jgi:hypothetical protein
MSAISRSRNTRLRLSVAAGVVFILCAIGGVAIRMSHASLGPEACLSIAPGVCLSGSAAWLVDSARKPASMHTESLPVVNSDAN